MIDIKDEIIIGNPKYSITSNGDGTSNIELANEVIQQGSVLNRAVFKDINNVAYERPDSYIQQTIDGKLTNVFEFENITDTPRMNQRISVDMSGNFNEHNLLGTINTWNETSNTMATKNNMIITTSSTYADSLSAIQSLNPSSSPFWQSSQSATSWLKIDLGQEYVISKIAHRLNVNYNVVNSVSVKASLDDITYIDLYEPHNPFSDIQTKREYKVNYQKARYIKIDINLNEAKSFCVSNLEVYGDIVRDDGGIFPFQTENVEQTIINGKICSYILKYGVKYNLVYDGTNYNIDGTKPLFDITLTEEVNSIDLGDFYGLLKYDKIYEILIYNENDSLLTSTSGSKDVALKNTSPSWMNNIFNVYNRYNTTSFNAYIKKGYVYGSNLNLINCIAKTSEYSTQLSWWGATFNNGSTQSIAVSDSSIKFKVGTRIIIKEVS